MGDRSEAHPGQVQGSGREDETGDVDERVYRRRSFRAMSMAVRKPCRSDQCEHR